MRPRICAQVTNRKLYEMTEEEFRTVLAASQPVAYMIAGGSEPSSPYENAMKAWRELGEKHGFDANSVRASNNGPRWFTALPKDRPHDK